MNMNLHYLAVIIIFFLVFAFIIQILFVSSNNQKSNVPPVGLRSRIEIKTIPSSSEIVQLPVNEFDRLKLIEKQYSILHQNHETSETFTDQKSQPANLLFKLNQTLDPLHSFDPSNGLSHDIPEIVKAWRNAKLDWHSLLPPHNSVWERFGTPKQEGKLRLLVSKEVQLTDLLTQFQSSGLAGRFGKDHGALSSYITGDSLLSPCMIHNQPTCASNSFCEWSEEQSLCVDSIPPSSPPPPPTHCPHPTSLSSSGTLSPIPASPSPQCSLWVSESSLLLSLDSEAQSMFYHWWASWTAIHDHWERELGSSRRVHFLVEEVHDPMFFHFFGLLSDFGWRRARSQVPPGTCFCSAQQVVFPQARIHSVKTAHQILDHLQLNQTLPPPDRPKVGIISRRRKRFVLNEYSLVAQVQALGYHCELLPLESMTLHEQMAALRSLDVLVGIHGSALDNSVFLHPGAVLVQLLPYRVEHRVSFPASAQEAGVVYMEWQLKDPSLAVFHWDLLLQADAQALNRLSKEQYLAQGQQASSSRETLMFWINQDLIVPEEDWIQLIRQAVLKSPANLRLSL